MRRQGPRIDLWKQCEQEQQQAESHPASPASASDGDAARPDLAHRGASRSHQKARAAIHERYKNRAQRIHARARTQSSGVLETDLDTGASREVLTLRETNLDDLYRDLQHLLESIPPVGAAPTQSDKTRAKSLLDLEATAAMEAQLAAPARPPDTRAKSMEFLLDDGNKASIQVSIALLTTRLSTSLLNTNYVSGSYLLTFTLPNPPSYLTHTFTSHLFLFPTSYKNKYQLCLPYSSACTLSLQNAFSPIPVFTYSL